MADLFNEESCPCCGRAYETGQAPGFAAFWDTVPHKIARAAAEKAWQKLSTADRARAAEKVRGFYAMFAKTYPTASPLHVATYLNNRRWEDEGIQSAIPTSATKAAIAECLSSPVPAVREHAERMAARMAQEGDP